MIFDNAGSYADIIKYLPPKDLNSQGEILITTRSSNFLAPEVRGNFHLSQGLDPSEAIQLLKKISDRHTEDEVVARHLAARLDFSPLGIRLAGSHIRAVGDLSFEGYTQLLNKSVHEELIHRMDGPAFISELTQNDKQTLTLEAVVQIWVQKVKERKPQLFSILQYCGYLANEKIPLDLLSQLSRTDGEDVQHAKQRLRTALVGQTNYALLTYQSHDDSCYLHQTTQSVLRSLTSDPTQIIQEATSAILKLYPYDEYSDASIKRCSEVSDHMLALSQYAKRYPISVEVRISLLLTLGQVYHKFSRYEVEYRCLTESLGLVNESIQLDDPNTKVSILRVMASHNYDLGKCDEAIDLLNQALHLATDPVLIGGIYHDLAKNYRVVSPEHVLKAYQDALKACDSVSPKSKQCYLTMADSHAGIGLCLEDANDRIKALDAHKKALDIYESHLKGQNLCTAITYTNIGKLGLVPDNDAIYKFESLGMSQEDSAHYLLRGRNTKIGIHGHKTCSVAISHEWLGHMMLVSNQWEQALNYFQRAIDIYEDLLEKGSNRELDCYNAKAMALEKSQDPKHRRLAVEVYNQIWQATKPPSTRTELHERASKRLQHLQLIVEAI